MFQCRKERMKALTRCQRFVWNALGLIFELEGDVETAPSGTNTTAVQI